MGLPGGGYVQARCGDLNDDPKKRAFPKRLRIPPPCSVWPEFLQELSDQQGLVDLPSEGEGGQTCWILGASPPSGNEALAGRRATLTDEDDLEYRALVTFRLWLKSKLAEALVTTLSEDQRDDTAALVHAFRENEPVNKDLTKDLWEKLIGDKQADVLGMRLRPPAMVSRASSRRNKTILPTPMDRPANPLIRRTCHPSSPIPAAPRGSGKLPAHYRQNHPSFRGRPVFSESELVGPSLHLRAERRLLRRITPAAATSRGTRLWGRAYALLRTQ